MEKTRRGRSGCRWTPRLLAQGQRPLSKGWTVRLHGPDSQQEDAIPCPQLLPAISLPQGEKSLPGASLNVVDTP